MQVPENPILDPRVQARRQKDMDGFVEQHQELVDKRAVQYAGELQETWQRIGTTLDDSVKRIYKTQAVDGVLPKGAAYDAARLTMIRAQTNYLTQVSDKMNQKMTKKLMAQYAESYYITAFKTEQATKLSVKVPILTESQVMGIVANPWLPDGRTYSDRLRANTGLLAKNMREIVEEAVATGLSVHDTARLIEARTGESYSNAVRLARTELTRAAAQGQTQLYMENADVMDGKRWNATLDTKTAPKDAANDGKLYPIDYDTPENPGEPGERIPNHPNCRCAWSPVLSALGVNKRERIAREETGERTYTKARTYEEYADEKGLPSLKDRLEGDNPRSYFRRGETFKDYANAVGKTEAEFLGTVNGKEIAKALGVTLETIGEVTTAVGAGAVFTPAKTIKEANSWAAENIPQVATIDYTDYDLQLANSINENLQQLFVAFPEITGINYIGTAQRRNSGWYEAKVQQVFDLNKDKLRAQGFSDEAILKAIKSKVKRPKGVDSHTRAQAANTSWGDYAGITFNKVYAKDYDYLKQSVERSVSRQWHPKGTEDPISVLVHEFGHSIDYFLDEIGLRDKYITPITREVLRMSRNDIKLVLSEYASTNHREVVAEAFAEYRLNPKPRQIAKRIGEAIEAALDEYRRLEP
jgi:SPP1 gp7 family putative phage head morphogenesis protein